MNTYDPKSIRATVNGAELTGIYSIPHEEDAGRKLDGVSWSWTTRGPDDIVNDLELAVQQVIESTGYRPYVALYSYDQLRLFERCRDKGKVFSRKRACLIARHPEPGWTPLGRTLRRMGFFTDG